MAPVLTEHTLTLEQLLALPKEVRAELVAVMERLHATRYTGPVTLHFHLGVPKTVQLLPPQIRLTNDNS